MRRSNWSIKVSNWGVTIVQEYCFVGAKQSYVWGIYPLTGKTTRNKLTTIVIAPFISHMLVTIAWYNAWYGAWYKGMVWGHGMRAWYEGMVWRHDMGAWYEGMVWEHGRGRAYGGMVRRHGTEAWYGGMIRRHGTKAWYEGMRLNLDDETNVFYRYFAHYGYFDRAESSVFQVRRQRQRHQASHLFAIWRVSKLDFMIISPRAKSEMNFLQNSSQLRLLRKCTFASLKSCDANLIKTHIKLA